MTRPEAITVVEMIVHGWPGPAWEVPRMEAYIDSFLPLDAKVTTQAVLRARNTLRYRPSIAELREFIHIEQRLAEPDEPAERRPAQSLVRPAWTVRWARARANGDWRHFPQQCEYVGAPEPFTDRAVWVQDDEYQEGQEAAADAIVDLPDVSA